MIVVPCHGGAPQEKQLQVQYKSGGIMINLELKDIFISKAAGQPMESVRSAEVDHGGIVDDRYHIDKDGLAQGTYSNKKVGVIGRMPNSHRAVTVFSDGDFEASLHKFREMLIEAGLDSMEFTPIMMRRNLFVSAKLGLLNALLSTGEILEFRGSELKLAPVQMCTPCNLPPTYIVDPEKELKLGMDGYTKLVAVQTAFKIAFAETAGIRTTIINPGGINI